jgi:hypothetical protein
MTHGNGTLTVLATMMALLFLPAGRPANATSFTLSGTISPASGSPTLNLAGAFDYPSPLIGQFTVQGVALPSASGVATEVFFPPTPTPFTEIVFVDSNLDSLKLFWSEQDPIHFHGGPLVIALSSLDLNAAIVVNGQEISPGTYLFQSGSATAVLPLTATPEPNMWLLWASTVTGLGFIARRRQVH